MDWWTIIGVGVHRLARPRAALHAAHRLPRHHAAPARQRRLPPRHPVDLPGRRFTTATASRSSPTARSSIRRCATPSCAAEASINLEAYIFQPGEAADMLIDAMVERAQAGVEVRIVLDAIGSSRHGRQRRAAAARRAAASVSFYQPLTLVPAAPAEQPHAPRAAGRRRPRRVHRRRRRRRLVAASRPTASRRGATRWRASKDRSSPRCRASSPRTGSSAAARS